jgi:CheY-like chemotaxis protein
MTTLSVLLVDDDPDVCGSLIDLLEDAGHLVECASSADEALARLKAGARPDALLVNYHLGARTGLELLAACQQHEELDNIPAVVTSGFSREEVDADLQWLFLRKPFQPEELLGALAAIASAAAVRRLAARRPPPA